MAASHVMANQPVERTGLRRAAHRQRSPYAWIRAASGRRAPGANVRLARVSLGEWCAWQESNLRPSD